MNVIGHLLIAASVRRAVLRGTGFRLSRAGFLYGNILPDFSARYAENPHFFKDSRGFILERAATLRREGCAERSFAGACGVGVMTHYLSDFFCYAHSEPCAYGICRHHLYELCMLRGFAGGLHAYREEASQGACLSPGADALEPFLLGLVREYGSARPSPRRDFRFALTACCGAAAQVLAGAREGPGRPAPAALPFAGRCLP